MMALQDDNKTKVEDVFKNKQWQTQAEDPGALEQIGHKLDATLSSKGKDLKSYIDDLKLAYKMLRDPKFQIEKETKVVLIIALLYVISPIDLIPDAIPFLGMVDDVLVAGYALKQAATELERYRKTVTTT
jgi:uncharacterized membrane protein YkvA (DUF1232 family)